MTVTERGWQVKQMDCPRCGSRIDLSALKADKKMACLKCGKRFSLAPNPKSRSDDSFDSVASSEPVSQANDATKLLTPQETVEASRSNSQIGVRETASKTPDSLLPTPKKHARTNAESHGDQPRLSNQDLIVPAVVASIARQSIPASEVLDIAERRRAFRQRLAAGSMLLLVVACGIGGYFILNPLAPHVIDATTSDQTPIAKSGESDSPTTTTKAIAPAIGREPPLKSAEPPPSLPPKPIEWGQARSVARRELEKLWAQIHPYSFRLTAKFSHSERVVTGLVIDSRGWVVTSLSAIQGAQTVMATPAPANALIELPSDAIRDEVRGVLAIDRPHDLVLLQVNRRLINVLTTLQPTEKLLVPGRSLIQVAAIGTERLPWLTECQIERELPRAQFSAELNRKLEALKVDLSPYWPSHDSPLETGAGGGLFTEDGKLGGLNTGVTADGKVYFVEAARLFDLVKSAKEPVESLASLVPEFAKAVTKGSGGEVDWSGGTTPFEPGHEAYDVSADLVARATVCETFAWVPQNEEQQVQLREGLQAYRDSLSFLRQRLLQKEDAERFRSQVGFWRDRLSKSIFVGDAAMEIRQNELALSGVDNGGPFDAAIFVKVAIQAGSSPKLVDQDTVTLQILGTDRYLIVPVSARTAPMLPDSKWLVIVVIEPGEESAIMDGDRRVRATRARSLAEISEVNSGELFGKQVP